MEIYHIFQINIVINVEPVAYCCGEPCCVSCWHIVNDTYHNILIHSFILNIYIAPLQENYSEAQLLRGAGMHNPRAGSGPRRSFIQPSEQVKKYKKCLLDDRDFMSEFKLH